MQDTLHRGFKYDRWANQIWLETLRRQNRPQEEYDQLAHILAAQEIWHQRVTGSSPTSLPPIEPNEQAFDRLLTIWLDHVNQDDLKRVHCFKRITGKEGQLSLEDIAQHLINHGTYHRGVLRGLALAEGRTDFEDTDLSRYYGIANR